jgi:hypothetical protein
MSIVISQQDLCAEHEHRDVLFNSWTRVRDVEPEEDRVEIYFLKLFSSKDTKIQPFGEVIERIRKRNDCAGYTCAKGVLSRRHQINEEVGKNEFIRILFFGTVLKDGQGVFRVPVLCPANHDWQLLFKNIVNEGFSQNDYLAVINKSRV